MVINMAEEIYPDEKCKTCGSWHSGCSVDVCPNGVNRTDVYKNKVQEGLVTASSVGQARKEIEVKTKSEKLQELTDTIHELRKRELLTIDYIEKESRKLIDTLTELEKQLIGIQDGLLGKGDAPKIEAKMAYVLIKIIDARKSVLDGWKMTLKECRLALTFLVKEEGRIEYMMQKASSE
jgi:hypothetical protein